MRRACWSTSHDVSAACLAERMRAEGVPGDAVLLASLMPEGGFLQRLDTAEGVRLAWFNMPFRHNDNHVLLMIDAHDTPLDGGEVSDIPREQLLADSRYEELYERHPGLSIWPSDRSPEHDPVIDRFPRGGMRVILDFRVLDGCRACRRLGFMRVAWYFGSDGVFRGKKFLGMYGDREHAAE
jgi:hypothetical protein